jgi:hypothetical protein
MLKSQFAANGVLDKSKVLNQDHKEEKKVPKFEHIMLLFSGAK